MRNYSAKLLSKLTLVAAMMAVISCNETNPVTPPDEQPTITIKQGELVTSSSISVKISPSENSLGCKYAIGRAGDAEAFEDETLESLESTLGNKVVTKTFTALSPNTEYTVFAQSVGAKGVKSVVTTIKISTIQESMSLSIEIIEVDYASIKATINPGSNSANYRYAIGVIGDLAAFESGTLAETKVVGNEITTKVFDNLDQSTEYTIFAQATSSAGTVGEVETAKATTKIIDFPYATVEFSDQSVFNVKTTITPNELTGKYIATVISKEFFEAEFGATLQLQKEEMEWLASQGEAIISTTAITGHEWELGGFCDFSYVALVLLYDKTNTASRFIIEEFKSPQIDNTLLKPTLSISISDVISSVKSARVKFDIEGSSTTGYHYSLIPGTFFIGELESDPAKIEDFFYGDALNGYQYTKFAFATVDHTYTGMSYGDYYAVALPLNANGYSAKGDIVVKKLTFERDGEAVTMEELEGLYIVTGTPKGKKTNGTSLWNADIKVVIYGGNTYLEVSGMGGYGDSKFRIFYDKSNKEVYLPNMVMGTIWSYLRKCQYVLTDNGTKEGTKYDGVLLGAWDSAAKTLTMNNPHGIDAYFALSARYSGDIETGGEIGGHGDLVTDWYSNLVFTRVGDL